MNEHYQELTPELYERTANRVQELYAELEEAKAKHEQLQTQLTACKQVIELEAAKYRQAAEAVRDLASLAEGLLQTPQKIGYGDWNDVFRKRIEKARRALGES